MRPLALDALIRKKKNTVLSNSVDMGSLKSRDKKSVNEKRSHWR